MSTKFNLRLAKNAFLRLGIKLILAQKLQNFAEMSQMLTSGIGVNNDIIEIYNDRFIEKWLEYLINEGLKCSGGIREPKWHN